MVKNEVPENKLRVAIIDGDSFAWIVGYNNKDNDLEGMVLSQVDNYISSILKATEASYYIGYLANEDSSSFRKRLSTEREYKGTRGEKPDWYNTWEPIINNHLITSWKFEHSGADYEADDYVALATRVMKESGYHPVICGVDKDLLQIEGEHYNYSKAVTTIISPEEAKKRLFLQVLTGDSTDNIAGLPKCGPKTAELILGNCDSEEELAHSALRAYTNKLGTDLGIRQFYLNYMLVKLHDSMKDVTINVHPFEKSVGAIIGDINMKNEETVDISDDLFKTV